MTTNNYVLVEQVGEDLEFQGETWEEHVEAFRAVDESLQNHMWILGAISDSLTRRYGQRDVKRFASEVGKATSTVYDYAKTYRAWKGRTRSQILTWTHHKIAASAPDPEKAIEAAEIEQLSTRQLQAAVDGIEYKPREYTPPDEVVSEPSERLDFWRERIAAMGCLLKRWDDTHSCEGRIEFAHLEGIPSGKHSGFVNRREGFSRALGIGLCADAHRTGKRSLHNVGEEAFVDRLGGYKRVFGWLLGQSFSFITELREGK